MEALQLTLSFLPGFQSGWNQFEANEKLFGVVSSFDENIYTTKLDKTKLSTAQSREAERLAQEIERQTSGNFHLQEERGQRVQDDGLDEEARYSSVDRSKGSPAASGVGLQSLRWLHRRQLTRCVLAFVWKRTPGSERIRAAWAAQRPATDEWRRQVKGRVGRQARDVVTASLLHPCRPESGAECEACSWCGPRQAAVVQ